MTFFEPPRKPWLLTDISLLYTFITSSAIKYRIFGILSRSNGLLVDTKITDPDDRLPNQSLYESLLFRAANSLNFTKPLIHDESEVIVLVCSALKDVDIRDTIRRTWASPAFSEAVKNKVVSVVFLVGTDKMSDVVWREITSAHDILQVDVRESYPNLVYKILSAYRWIHENHPNKFVLKIDSDTITLLDKIESILGSSTKKSIQCYSYTNVRPERKMSSAWYIPETVFSERYLPGYCSGPMYLMSPVALSAILRVAPEEQVFEVEDAFFTGVLADKAGVKITKRRGIWHREKNSQPCVNRRGTVIAYPVHSASPKRLAQAWDHLRNLRCRWVIEHFLLTYLFDD